MDIGLEAENSTIEWMHAEDTDLFDCPPSITLYARGMLEFTPEAGASVAEWTALAVACETKSSCCMDWRPTNGAMSIEVDHETVKITVGRYGDGRGGSIDIHLLPAECIAAFREAARLTETWLAQSK